MQKFLKYLSLVAKGLAVLTGLASYTTMIPPKWAGIAVVVFGIASILKDTVNRIGDYLDDGEANNSFQK